MSAALALDYTYQYAYPSVVDSQERGWAIRLATCGAQQEKPYFFDGALRRPRQVADMLMVLANVVRTHFFLQRPVLLDPVVTSSESMLRFEGFSGCCGVYVRADLKPEAFTTDIQNRGTTNIDFNNPMRAALSRIRPNEEVRLAVGCDEFKLVKQQTEVVEKKVKLPVRWIKGFSEVQAYQPGLKLWQEISSGEALRFIRTLPRGGKLPLFISAMGPSLRAGNREKPNSIRLTGTDRIKLLEQLLGNAQKLRVWYNDQSGVSGWEVRYEIGSLLLLVSPELYRGFSGEGQALGQLIKTEWQAALPKVQAQLCWQAHLDAGALAARTGLEPEAVNAALAVLGSRGLAGYDLESQSYFHRVLPFDLEQVEKLQPRLKAARKLLEEKNVTLVSSQNDKAELSVTSTKVTHTVWLAGDDHKCTCPWYNKYLGQRGMCKHVLAARMFLDGMDGNNQEGEFLC